MTQTGEEKADEVKQAVIPSDLRDKFRCYQLKGFHPKWVQELHIWVPAGQEVNVQTGKSEAFP